MFMKFYLETT